MKAKDNRNASRSSRSRIVADKHNRKAARLERMYRELGFVYAESATPCRLDGRKSSLAPVDFRPRANLTFSALSI